MNVRSGYAAPGIDSTPTRPRRALTPEEEHEIERLLFLEQYGDRDPLLDDDSNDPAWGPPPPIPEVAAREADRLSREYPAGT